LRTNMDSNRAMAVWESVRILRQAFREQQAVVGEVHALAGAIVRSPPDTPAEFAVALDPLPDRLLTLRCNLFSTLFQSAYHLLEIDPGRRRLYGKLNYLFRIWVTGADNLLDQEDKITLPIRMPGQSRVMRQVVTIMAADRVLARLLNAAVSERRITAEEADILSEKSLQLLLPSAAQEASEEGGILDRPRPEYVLHTIHRLKTGLLFHLPFLGPELIERGVDRRKMMAMKDALMKLGLGCQLLDDIRDMARDHRERRQNYVLSCLQWSADSYARVIDKRRPGVEERIYAEAPQVTLPAARLAMKYLRDGLAGMRLGGLAMRDSAIERLAGSLFEVLDLGELRHAL
jgi:hypothetical protein